LPLEVRNAGELGPFVLSGSISVCGIVD